MKAWLIRAAVALPLVLMLALIFKGMGLIPPANGAVYNYNLYNGSIDNARKPSNITSKAKRRWHQHQPRWLYKERMK